MCLQRSEERSIGKMRKWTVEKTVEMKGQTAERIEETSVWKEVKTVVMKRWKEDRIARMKGLIEEKIGGMKG